METQSRVLKWSLIIGIIIVLNLFFNYALSLAYKSPEYEAFCPNTAQVVNIPDNEEACVSAGGQWTNNNLYSDKPERGVIQTVQPKGYCDQQFTCRTNYEAARKVYDRNVFITLVILGALCVAAGTFF